MRYPQLKPISKEEMERSKNRQRALIVYDDMERISAALAEGNEEVLTALHMELDGTYQSSIKGWSSGMFAFFKDYGFNYEHLDISSIAHNLTTMKGKLRGFMLQLDPEVELRGRIKTIKEDKQVAGDYSNKKVFIVHGHDDSLLGKVRLLLHEIGLEPVVLRDEVNAGQTIIEKIERNTDVGYGIVLYTQCDEGRKIGEVMLNKRARQNVVFEHGYLIAKLGRDRVAALNSSDVEIPSDLHGVLYISLADNGWKNELMREMLAAGLKLEPMKASI